MAEPEQVAQWAVLDDYSYTPVEIIRETKSTVFYKCWNHARDKFVERKSLSAMNWRGSEADARALSAKLRSAFGEKSRRQNEAAKWFQKRKAELLAIRGQSNGA